MNFEELKTPHAPHDRMIKIRALYLFALNNWFTRDTLCRYGELFRGHQERAVTIRKEAVILCDGVRIDLIHARFAHQSSDQHHQRALG